MRSLNMLVALRAPLLATLVVAAACGKDAADSPVGVDSPANSPTPAAVNTGVELSSATAARGAQVAVGVILEAELPQPAITLQGFLRYDTSRLRYVGQVMDEKGALFINDTKAGELRLLAVNTNGLGRKAAALVFEVTGTGYDRGLRFDLEEISDRSGEAWTRGSTLALRTGDGAVPAARGTLDMAAWNAEFAKRGLPVENGPTGLLNTVKASTRFGDVNLSGTITAGDLSYIGNVSVGLVTLNDAALNRDGILAGNVAPANAPGLGEPGDTCRPGAVCTPAGTGVETAAGTITGADVGQIALEIVVPATAVVGELIPRAGVAGGRRNIAGGTYTAASCTADPTLCNWTAGTVYQLDGIVEFDGGAVLTIAAGTRIEGNSAVSPNALYIRRDAQIFANGTASQPIIFTCTGTKQKGCWGGVAIGGNAPVNLQQSGAVAALPLGSTRNPAGGGNTRILEGTDGTPLVYGGSNPTDNSGSLRYVIIEYAGFVVGTNNELNGLTLGGVGSGTVLENIQIHGGLDDGIEFFGGTANARNLLLTANSDDGFDWSFGWQGSAQFVIVQQDSLDAEKGMEGDNSEGTGATFNETPRTNGPLYNFTLIGTLYPSSTSGAAGNNVNDAVHIRRGNRSSLVNSIIVGFPVGLDLDDAATCANAAGDPAIRNTTLIDVTVAGNADTGDPACETGVTETEVINNAVNANTITTGAATNLVRAFNVQNPDFRPIAGSTAGTGSVAAPPAGNTFIQSTTFRGAVPVATSITQNNIAFYMGWTRGWTSASQP
jgi:hypothetical protein